jgi:hypothetical protein
MQEVDLTKNQEYHSVLEPDVNENPIVIQTIPSSRSGGGLITTIITLLFALCFCCLGFMSLVGGASYMAYLSTSFVNTYDSSNYTTEITVGYESISKTNGFASSLQSTYYYVDTALTLANVYYYPGYWNPDSYYIHMCTDGNVTGYAQAYYPPNIENKNNETFLIPQCSAVNNDVTTAPGIYLCSDPDIYISLISQISSASEPFTLQLYVDDNCFEDCLCSYALAWLVTILVLISIGIASLCCCCVCWCVALMFFACFGCFGCFTASQPAYEVVPFAHA